MKSHLNIAQKRVEISKKMHRFIMDRDNKTCRYCLGVADCVDHIIPQAFKIDNSEGNLVASCMLCNAIAGSKVFEGLCQKQLFILKRLHKIIKRAGRKVWAVSDLDQLKGRLRTYVKSNCIIVASEEEAVHIQAKLDEEEQRLDSLFGLIGKKWTEWVYGGRENPRYYSGHTAYDN